MVKAANEAERRVTADELGEPRGPGKNNRHRKP
jgi:hypothetical protein